MAYAINNRTKEHRVIDNDPILISPEYNILGADPDGWIPWHGGECPLPDGSRFDAKTKDGGVHENCRGWRWTHDDVISDIIAYRPILDAKIVAARCDNCDGIGGHIGDVCSACGGSGKPESGEWDGEGLPPVGCECEVRHLDTTDMKWRRMNITAITADYVVGYIRDDRESAIRRDPLLEFRPIRSEEDRLTEEAVELIGVESDEYGAESVIYRMIRAGYRRT